MMTTRRHDDESSPSALMGIAFAAVLLVVGCTDAFADLLVTDLRGPVAIPGSREPVALMQTLKPGTKLVLPAGASVELYDAAAATVQPVSGPARLAVGAQGVKAESGTLGPVRKLGEAFRNVKVDSKDVSLGSLRMRSADARIIRSPEGSVGLASARQFRWEHPGGDIQFELSTLEGELVYRARASQGLLELPESIALKPGTTYVWGLASGKTGEPPVDWTEFSVGEDARTQAQGLGTGATERRLYASTLRSAGMYRAATRVLTAADQQR